MSEEVRHFVLETKDLGIFDVVEYKEYLKQKEEIERLNKALVDIKEQLKYKTNDSAINMLSILEIIEDIVNKALGSDSNE